LVTALIADDEPLARRGLQDMLLDHRWIACVGEAESGGDALRLIDDLRPDLVFLDIQMPGASGLDVLRRVVHQPFVVFTTAFAEHAVTAFELGAIDYLLKPFGAERLKATLDRVRAALGEPRGNVADRLTEAMGHGPMRRLFVRLGGSIIPISVERVSHFEAWGDYVTAHAGRARHVIHLSLNRLEQRLDPSRFVRVHRAYIVNLDHVRAFRSQGKGKFIAELSDGATVTVSRSKARALRALGA
jgi:two-component system LytT family response regulator